MQISQLVFIGLGAVALAAPGDRGQYTVPGLGARKQAITNAGGTTLDLAIAMLETETMTTDYAYGDNKVNDAANFGLFKQNWGMLRACASSAGFVGQSESEWNNGAILNEDTAADVTARAECQAHFGYDTWFAGHRNGESGLNNPNTEDIAFYKESIQWIQSQIESDGAYLTDDTRFWVDVTPI
ncbi:hypothetical protein VUR80DRAFT_1142 [Thermomyces stellatus]